MKCDRKPRRECLCSVIISLNEGQPIRFYHQISLRVTVACGDALRNLRQFSNQCYSYPLGTRTFSKRKFKQSYNVHGTLSIFRDSQAALMTMTNPKVTSRLVSEWRVELRVLADRNILTQFEVPKQSGITGNEKAD